MADFKGKGRQMVDIHAQTETECSEIPSEGGSSAAPAPATPPAQDAAAPEVRAHCCCPAAAAHLGTHLSVLAAFGKWWRTIPRAECGANTFRQRKQNYADPTAVQAS